MPTENGDTEVRVVLRVRLLGEDPSRQVADDLRRLKQVVEAGEAG